MPIGLLNNTLINDLRTSLLLRNLNPTPEATVGGVGSMNVNRGFPAETSLSQGEYIPLNQYNVSSLGHYQLKLLSLKNRYAPSDFTSIEITDTSAIAGNIGVYTDFVRTNTNNSFDLKQFVLNAPSILGYQDTPLGVIGAEQLKFSLEANIAANTSKNTLGRVNLNLFSLLNGEEFLIRDYQITEVPNTPLGFFVNLAQKYSGFELPVSYIPNGAFGFFESLFDGKVIYGDCNLQSGDITIKDQARMEGKDRNDILLRYTGRGNRVQLFNLLGINKYRPNYDDPNGSDSGLNRIFGFLQQRKNNAEAGYTTLDKTRRNSGPLPVMLKQGIAEPIGKTSLGNNRLSVIDKNLEGVVGAFKENDVRSVLQNNGLPKVTWTNKDTKNGFKKFMFSIENLAWIGNTEGLPDCEIGNGDTDSDDQRPGRVMWFPPYDLSFNESVGVAWEKTNFIGRGEPIFTYNNTTRSGSIKFKIIVDHPSILNQLRNKFADNEILKFFKGCDDYVNVALSSLTKVENSGLVSSEIIETAEQKIIDVAQKQSKIENNYTTKPGGTKEFSIKIYYDNNQTSVSNTYENGTGFNLNSTGDGFESSTTISNLQSLTPETVSKVEAVISVAATSTGTDQINTTLLDGRFKSAESWLLTQLIGIEKIIARGSSITVPNTNTGDVNSKTEKDARFALIKLTVFLKDLTVTGSTTVETTTFSKQEVQDKVLNTVQKVLTNVYTECDYFKFLESDTPFTFRSLKEKLKYFQPGFHSITPEGFNSRLTFLHQCTRQGPAINESGGKSNLAFGRPPILILRIGDFFHTKMVIETMSIEYDEGLWDLNPEGIGVQPRLATVNLSVSYLGGQSLTQPIRELQNALGFKFYANTETFQHEPIFVVDSITRIDNTLTVCDDINQGLTGEPPFVTPTIDEINNTVPVDLNTFTTQQIPLGQQPLTSTSGIDQFTIDFNNSFSTFNNLTSFGGSLTTK